MILHPLQEKAVDLSLDSSIDSLFITGAGGTGKSAIINLLKDKIPSYELTLLAPTNSAAENIEGTTIHKFFKVNPIIDLEVENEDEVLSFNIGDIDSNLTNGKVVIIDEVSMLGESMMKDLLSRITPKKLILFGDPEQLDPVKEKPVNWSNFCEETVVLTHNYRIKNNKLKNIVSHYRENAKIKKDVDKVKSSKELVYNEDTVYIAHTNSRLSGLQNTLLGYDTSKTGDKLLTFGNCDESIKGVNTSNGKKIVRPYFVNNDTVTATGEPFKPFGIDGDLYLVEVRSDKYPKYESEYGKTPYVMVGDYDEYKRILEIRFKAAQKYQRKMFAKYKVTKTGVLKRHMNDIETAEFKRLWKEYFQIKNIPYARHHQFRTTYKAQGKSFKNVVVDWDNLPSFDHKYVAISRAMENLTLIKV